MPCNHYAVCCSGSCMPSTGATLKILSNLSSNSVHKQMGNIAGVFSQLAAFASVISLGFIQPTKENLMKRKGLLGLFGFCQGLAIGPLLSLALNINPAIIFNATAGSFAIFVSFSLSALLPKCLLNLYTKQCQWDS